MNHDRIKIHEHTPSMQHHQFLIAALCKREREGEREREREGEREREKEREREREGERAIPYIVCTRFSHYAFLIMIGASYLMLLM